jgi:hypothetical protein
MMYSKNPAAREPAISSPRAKGGFVILRVLAGVRLYVLWHYYCLSSEHDHEGSGGCEYRMFELVATPVPIQVIIPMT